MAHSISTQKQGKVAYNPEGIGEITFSFIKIKVYLHTILYKKFYRLRRHFFSYQEFSAHRCYYLHTPPLKAGKNANK